MSTVIEVLREGLAQQQQGQFVQADYLFRLVLSADPHNVDALHLLGVSALHQERHTEAESFIRQALAVQPNAPPFHNNLGLVCRALGRLAEAQACFRESLRLRPEYAEGWNNLGIVCQDLQEHAEALECFDRSIAAKRSFAEAWVNRGIALQRLRRFAEALAAYHEAIRLKRDDAIAYLNLGTLLRETHQPLDALQAYDQALQFNPKYATALSNRGTLLGELGRHDEAEQSYLHAIALQPKYAKFHYNLGNFYRVNFRRAEAEQRFLRAIECDPRLGDAWINLGKVYQDEGRLDDADRCYRRALEIDPRDALALDNLIMNESYRSDALAEVAKLWQQYDAMIAQPLLSTKVVHANVVDPERVVRVAFISADLGNHPIGRLMTHVLAGLRHSSVHTVCYSNRDKVDDATQRLRQSSHLWRDVAMLDDAALVERIRADAIDILIDLSGHTAGNRLRVLARKPAPVQATWMGFAGSTGMSAIDYLLTDEQLVPRRYEHFYREQVVRLPLGGACFELPSDAPPIGPPPSLHSGRITFASFNNPTKISPAARRAWGEILRRTPNSRLIFKFQGLGDPRLCEQLLHPLREAGIERERVEFQDFSPLPELLALYNQIDVALDPFPYTGGTSTMLALWMGVPVVTLVGESLAARQSFSLLHRVGLDELATSSVDEYIERTVAVALNVAQRHSWRGELRERFRRSAFGDPTRFVPTLEAALRDLWRRWCHEQMKGNDGAAR